MVIRTQCHTNLTAKYASSLEQPAVLAKHGSFIYTPVPHVVSVISLTHACLSAAKMASLGARLAICDINLQGLIATNDLCGGGHLAEIVDVASSEACNSFIVTIINHYSRLDHVFNCAGVNPTAYALTDTTDAYYDRLANTNLKGTYSITRAAIPHLPSGSSIVNVSSMMGVTVAANYAIYCMTKWGIVGFTKAMALELGPKGVRCNAVAPGYINTPTNAGVLAGPEAVAAQEKRVAMGRMGTPEEVADVVAYLFSNEARYVTGSIVEVNGGRT